MTQQVEERSPTLFSSLIMTATSAGTGYLGAMAVNWIATAEQATTVASYLGLTGLTINAVTAAVFVGGTFIISQIFDECITRFMPDPSMGRLANAVLSTFTTLSLMKLVGMTVAVPAMLQTAAAVAVIFIPISLVVTGLAMPIIKATYAGQMQAN